LIPPEIPDTIVKRKKNIVLSGSPFLMCMEFFVALSNLPSKHDAWQYLGVLDPQMLSLRLPQTIPTPFSILKNLPDHQKTPAWCDSGRFLANMDVGV